MMMQPDVAKKMVELDHAEQMILNEEEEKADRVSTRPRQRLRRSQENSNIAQLTVSWTLRYQN